MMDEWSILSAKFISLCKIYSHMNVLLLGGGGREHAIAWKITKSPKLSHLYIAPGNAGTNAVGTNVSLNILDFDSVKTFCKKNAIEMLIVGPEAPLVAGIYDAFASDETTAHIVVIGPSKAGAQLEGSKAFAKEFMAQFDIQTAAYIEVTQNTLQKGLDHIDHQDGPYVLKADGLAAGKGVLIIDDKATAKAELSAMLDGKFGDASTTVVIEAFLSGIEFSVFVLTDGKDYKTLPVAKDYKRIGEGDTGLNTGGMGAVSPPPFVDATMMQKVEERIIQPTMKGLSHRAIDYKGFIFLGLIEVDGDPFVIEYNCRLGDPETEVVLPRIQEDLLPILASIGSDDFKHMSITETPQTAATVMLVSGGYPEKYEKGKVITDTELTTESIVFHAGTKLQDDQIVTNGGRVIAVTNFGNDVQDAVTKSLADAKTITFDGKYYRKDIGFDL